MTDLGIKIEDIQRLEVKHDDILFIKMSNKMSRDAVNRIGTHLKERLKNKNVTIVFIHKDTEVFVVNEKERKG